MKKLIWLDDVRNPLEKNWLSFSPLEPNKPVEVNWIKSYTEFVCWIKQNGLPDAICFDHDLGTEMTGYDCAKWLVEYCMENGCQLPLWNIQSSNPVGKDNINSLFNSFIKNSP